jgi:hypothetical protein
MLRRGHELASLVAQPRNPLVVGLIQCGCDDRVTPIELMKDGRLPFAVLVLTQEMASWQIERPCFKFTDRVETGSRPLHQAN